MLHYTIHSDSLLMGVTCYMSTLLAQGARVGIIAPWPFGLKLVRPAGVCPPARTSPRVPVASKFAAVQRPRCTTPAPEPVVRIMSAIFETDLKNMFKRPTTFPRIDHSGNQFRENLRLGKGFRKTPATFHRSCRQPRPRLFMTASLPAKRAARRRDG